MNFRWAARALATLLAATSTGPLYAISIPLKTFPNDPDAQWKDGLYIWLDGHLNNLGSPQANAGYFSLPVGTNSPHPPLRNTWDLLNTPHNCSPWEEQFVTEQGWLLERETGPVMGSVNLPDAVFTLDYMEGSYAVPAHNVNTAVSVVQPLNFQGTIGMGFLYQFDYGQCGVPVGNPYYQDPGTLNRAIVILATELIMLDQVHKTLNNANAANYALASVTNNPSGYQSLVVDPACFTQGPLGPQPPRVGSSVSSPGGVPCPAQSTTLPFNAANYFAMALEDLAYEYFFIRPALPADLVAHLDQAFLRMGNRLATWGPWDLQINRTLPGANALFMIWHLTGHSQALLDYISYTKTLLHPASALYDQAGFFDDDHGWDVSYNRINLMHLGRLARMEQAFGPSPLAGWVLQTLEQMYRLKAHMTVADPDGHREFHYSPTHTSSRTPGDAMTGQGLRAVPAFDAIVVGVADAYPDLEEWDPTNLGALLAYPPNVYATSHVTADFNTTPNALLANYSDYIVPATGPYLGVRAWQTEVTPDYYRPGLSAALHDPSAGTFALWDQGLQATPDINLYPSERQADGYEVIDNDFVWYKSGPTSVLLHVGSVSHYEDVAASSPAVSHLPGGYGGGMISYLAHEDAGGLMLSWRRYRYENSILATESMDNWDLWDRWALQNLWLGVPAPGGGSLLTSSARNLTPQTTITTSGGAVPSTVFVVAKGAMPSQNARFGQVLNTLVEYERAFELTPTGVYVNTSTWASAPVSATDLVETLPLHGINYLDQGYYMVGANQPWEDLSITLFSASQGPIDAIQNPDLWVNDVEEILYERLVNLSPMGGATLKVRLDQPRRVKVTPEYILWKDYAPPCVDGVPAGANPITATCWSKRKNRNIVIDLLGNAGSGTPQSFTAAQVGYSIEAY